jgi:hypothetical protein
LGQFSKRDTKKNCLCLVNNILLRWGSVQNLYIALIIHRLLPYPYSPNTSGCVVYQPASQTASWHKPNASSVPEWRQRSEEACVLGIRWVKMADCSAYQTYRQFKDSKQEIKGEVLIIFLYKFWQNVTTTKKTIRIIETI